ncbi:protein dedD [Candidatus Photodesmus blepharus]|uniref:Protein dedD n=1 Tax=Candidatus Photodesmus blepharonis TaxID=1179155 RepID=A0A084CNC3_9GAMM|nr:SPOR domain-containing protein [Candidatus Photodesmus blepharus]KEY91302.1 protein dedD [Candidatus Photodesmus blepharus]
MANKFQNRLVGTIVLVAIGVIVLPDLLDGKKLHYEDEIMSIPIKPELESKVEVFEVLNPVESKAVFADIPEGVTKKIMSIPKEVDFEENKYQDSAWIIQLMALKNAQNANNIVKKLRQYGYQAHAKKDNAFTRVIIGPDVSKIKLESQLLELEKITGSKGHLLRFMPLNP